MYSKLTFYGVTGLFAIPAERFTAEQSAIYARVHATEDRLGRALTDAELLALASGRGERLAYAYDPATASPLGTRQIVIVLRDEGEVRRLSDGSLDAPATEAAVIVTKAVADRIRAAVDAVLVEATRTKELDPYAAETALCVWEEMLNRQRVKGTDDLLDGDVLRQAFADYGTASMRLFAVSVAGLVDRAWATLTAEEQDRVAFDWEFVPDLLQMVDWDFEGSDPAFREPDDVAAFAASVRADRLRRTA